MLWFRVGMFLVDVFAISRFAWHKVFDNGEELNEVPTIIASCKHIAIFNLEVLVFHDVFVSSFTMLVASYDYR